MLEFQLLQWWILWRSHVVTCAGRCESCTSCHWCNVQQLFGDYAYHGIFWMHSKIDVVNRDVTWLPNSIQISQHACRNAWRIQFVPLTDSEHGMIIHTDFHFQVFQSPAAFLTVNSPFVMDSIFPLSHWHPNHTFIRIETKSHFAFDTNDREAS